jgi:hypothetical protein
VPFVELRGALTERPALFLAHDCPSSLECLTLGISETRSAVRCMPLLRAFRFKRRPVGHEDDLARHASLPEQLVRLSCLGKRNSLCDERPDLLLLKEVEQGDQILSKQCRPSPFEPLDAVGDHAFPAREKPAAGNIHPENEDCTKAMTTT